MNIKYSNHLRLLAYRVYSPLVMIIERWRAVLMWHRGVRLCQKEHDRVKRPRVYLFYNLRSREWMPMSYERNRRDIVSMKQLIVMGKIHVKHTPSVEEMKQESFYYTSSANGAHGSYENSLRRVKLAQWISFYLAEVSIPIQKLRKFRRRFPQTRADIGLA